MKSLGMDAIAMHEQDLLQYAHAQLGAIDGVRLVGTAAHKAGVISFLVQGAHHYDVGKLLDAQGVAVRVGHHCAMPLMLHLGITGTVRASLGVYNSRNDIDRLAEGIRAAQEHLGSIRTRMHAVPNTNTSFEERRRTISDDLALFESTNEKREYLMELGNNLPPYDNEYRTEDYRIHGCQSMVWLRTECHENRLQFLADSDALITKGMIALMVHLLGGMTPQAIYDLDLDVVLARIGLPSLITARRKNGLASMAARIKQDALKHGACNYQ